MIKILIEIYISASDLLDKLFWDFTGSIYSHEASEFHKKVKSNHDNLKKYQSAVNDLRKGAEKVTFTLHDGEKITLH